MPRPRGRQRRPVAQRVGASLQRKVYRIADAIAGWFPFLEETVLAPLTGGVVGLLIGAGLLYPLAMVLTFVSAALGSTLPCCLGGMLLFPVPIIAAVAFGYASDRFFKQGVSRRTRVRAAVLYLIFLFLLCNGCVFLYVVTQAVFTEKIVP